MRRDELLGGWRWGLFQEEGGTGIDEEGGFGNGYVPFLW